jgi:hypothetical protein
VASGCGLTDKSPKVTTQISIQLTVKNRSNSIPPQQLSVNRVSSGAVLYPLSHRTLLLIFEEKIPKIGDS